MSDVMSPVEQLPLELSWIIFDYVPESIIAIRSTSSNFRSRVDDYIFNDCKLTIVKEFAVHRRSGMSIFDVQAVVHVPIHLSKIFKLRYIQSGIPIDQIGLVNSGHSVAFNLTVNYSDSDKAEKIRKCMGKRIGALSLYQCNECDANFVSKIIGGSQFANLSITSDNISNQTMKNFLNIIESNKVDHVSIEARNCRLTDSVATLKELSSLVKTLHINQQSFWRIAKHKRYFFGALDVDWAPVFIEMFTKKMKSLIIENDHYPKYLEKEGVDILKERLPRLNKRLCFKSTCDFNNNVECNKMLNDHLVMVSCFNDSHTEEPPRAVLTIKHVSMGTTRS